MFVEAHAFAEPSLSGKCTGLVVRVTDIKKTKNAQFSPCVIEIIYSTNMFHLWVTRGDRKRKSGRETKLNHLQ